MPRHRELDSRGPDWLVRAGLIARRFYLEGKSKVEIADELGMSRFKVARVLDEARELGLVKVSVDVPSPIDTDLSAQLRERYALRRALAVEHPVESGQPVHSVIGEVAAALLAELVKPDDVLGFTCSLSVAATTEALSSLPPCRVVQLSGTLAGPDLEAGSVESVRRAAALGGGKAFPIYAPMVLPDSATVRALSGQTPIRQAMQQYDDVTKAVVAISAWQPELSTVWDQLRDNPRLRTTAHGAVGEIAARLFDASGEPIASEIDDRVLGVTLAQLRRMPEVVGLAHDARKAGAVRAALTGGLVDTLVCDASLGRALLEQVPAEEVSA